MTGNQPSLSSGYHGEWGLSGECYSQIQLRHSIQQEVNLQWICSHIVSASYNDHMSNDMRATLCALDQFAHFHMLLTPVHYRNQDRHGSGSFDCAYLPCSEIMEAAGAISLWSRQLYTAEREQQRCRANSITQDTEPESLANMKEGGLLLPVLKSTPGDP